MLAIKTRAIAEIFYFLLPILRLVYDLFLFSWPLCFILAIHFYQSLLPGHPIIDIGTSARLFLAPAQTSLSASLPLSRVQEAIHSGRSYASSRHYVAFLAWQLAVKRSEMARVLALSC
jgi:hypothetical protein